jgi:hypothetical protein
MTLWINRCRWISRCCRRLAAHRVCLYVCGGRKSRRGWSCGGTVQRQATDENLLLCACRRTKGLLSPTGRPLLILEATSPRALCRMTTRLYSLGRTSGLVLAQADEQYKAAVQAHEEGSKALEQEAAQLLEQAGEVQKVRMLLPGSLTVKAWRLRSCWHA